MIQNPHKCSFYGCSNYALFRLSGLWPHPIYACQECKDKAEASIIGLKIEAI